MPAETTMHVDRVTESVIELVASQTRVRRSEIRLDTDLRKDLGVDGLAAEELMIEFSSRLVVEMDGYRHRLYFADEHTPLWFYPWLVALAAVFSLAFSQSLLAAIGIVVAAYMFAVYLGIRREQRRKPVRLQDLIDAAHRGRWEYVDEHEAV